MGDKKNKFEVVIKEDESDPSIVPGLHQATTKISGLRIRSKSTQYAEGPRATERPLQPADPASNIRTRILLPEGASTPGSLLELSVAQVKLREMGLDDELDDQSIFDGPSFQEVVNQKIKSREAIIAVLCKNFRYNWWNSKNPVERLWGQLNNAFMIVPKWQYMEDMKAVLCRRMDTMRPAGFAGVDLLVLRENKEAVKKQVYNKLVTEGFMDGDRNIIYTDAELDAIIATK